VEWIAPRGGRRAGFVFRSTDGSLTAISEWTAVSGPGPVELRLTIVNQSAEPVTLPLQESFATRLKVQPNQRWSAMWVEKAAGRPSYVGTHQRALAVGSGFVALSHPYESDKLAYSKDGAGRDDVPWLSLSSDPAGVNVYAGVESSGIVAITARRSAGGIEVRAGLAHELGRTAFTTVLQPMERYELPVVFVGAANAAHEAGSNDLKHWISDHLRPKAADPRYPLLTLNSWGSDMAINEDLAGKMISKAAELGIEMFHVDAGWFRTVGDWRPNLTKFPHGIASVADEAHAHGLKFGLWVAWTQGGIGDDREDRDCVLNVHAPDRQAWFGKEIPENWKPADFVGADLCLAEPAAREWCVQLLTKLVKEYHVDMLEHDQRMVVSECIRSGSHTSSPGDIADRAFKGYASVYDKVRERYPKLLFENCVNGGRMVDFGAAKRAHYFSIVDSYDPLSNRQAIFDLTRVLPPSMCECYVMKMPNKMIGEFVAMLRSGMMGWCTVMQDPNDWTPEQQAAAQQVFRLYKTRLRPFILRGDVYHVSERPDGKRWDGMEYASRDRLDGVVYAFRGTGTEGAHTFRLQGLVAAKKYRVHFEDPGQADAVLSGAQLMTRGLEIRIDAPGSSQIAFLDAK
jgi:hypothetical protein